MKREEAEKALREALKHVSEHHSNKDLADAIIAVIDTRIKEAIDDLDDKVHKRGQYDPEW